MHMRVCSGVSVLLGGQLCGAESHLPFSAGIGGIELKPSRFHGIYLLLLHHVARPGFRNNYEVGNRGV